MNVSNHRVRESFRHALAVLDERDPDAPVSVDGTLAALREMLLGHAEQEAAMVMFLSEQGGNGFHETAERDPTPADPPPSEEEKPLSQRGRRFETQRTEG